MFLASDTIPYKSPNKYYPAVSGFPLKVIMSGRHQSCIA
jgi:hypothetical protein